MRRNRVFAAMLADTHFSAVVQKLVSHSGRLVALVAVPAGTVTAIGPVDPVAGIAVICVLELTTKEAALVPPKVTAVAPVKFVPVITTGVVFSHPLAGVKLLILTTGM